MTKFSSPWVVLAVCCPIMGLAAFVGMQLAFNASDSGSMAVVLQILGFGLFAVWWACIVGTVVGVAVVIVKRLQRRS